MTIGAATLQARVARRLDYVQARLDLQRDLERLLASSPTVTAPGGPRIGFAALSSGPWHLALQIVLAHALRLRGASPTLLLCDAPDLPICNERLVTARAIDRCAGCVDDKRGLLDASALHWAGLSAFMPPDAIGRARAAVDALPDAELRAHHLGPWPIGQWLEVSAAHHLRRDGAGGDAEQVATRRRLLVSAIATLPAVERWLDHCRPAVVIAQGGVHVMWRIVFELARARGIDVVCREMGKGGWDHHLYALNRDSMAPDLDDAWARARCEPLTPVEERAVGEFLDQLPARTFPGGTAPGTVGSAGGGRRTVLAFSNVTWDMATVGRDAGFTGMADWLRATVRACSRLRDVHLVVRAHPAEAGDTRERVIDDVLRECQVSAGQVTLVPSADRVSAAALCRGADLVSVYNSTAGLEAAMRGSRVVVSGRPHFRGRGFTIDADSREHYEALLGEWHQTARLPLAEDAPALARRYAHMFYLRYHVPMGWTTSPLDPPFALTVKSLAELAPGRNRALDVVCDGILNHRQVLLPRDLAGAHPCGG